MKPTEADYDRALCEYEGRGRTHNPRPHYWPKNREDEPDRTAKLGPSSYSILRKAALNPDLNE